MNTHCRTFENLTIGGLSSSLSIKCPVLFLLLLLFLLMCILYEIFFIVFYMQKRKEIRVQKGQK